MTVSDLFDYPTLSVDLGTLSTQGSALQPHRGEATHFFELHLHHIHSTKLSSPLCCVITLSLYRVQVLLQYQWIVLPLSIPVVQFNNG